MVMTAGVGLCSWSQSSEWRWGIAGQEPITSVWFGAQEPLPHSQGIYLGFLQP